MCVFIQIGALGKFPTNSKDVEGTTVFRWLMFGALQNPELSFDKVMTLDGQYCTLTLREMIERGLFPPSHLKALKGLAGKQMCAELPAVKKGVAGADLLIVDDVREDAVVHPDLFYKTSQLHPLRALNPPCSLFSVVETSWEPPTADRGDHRVARVHFGTNASMAAIYGYVASAANALRPALPLEAAAYSSNGACRGFGDTRLWKLAFVSAHTDLHTSVSLVLAGLPILSQPAGAKPEPLRLGFEQRANMAARPDGHVWFSSRSGLTGAHDQFIDVSNQWTTLRLKQALGHLLPVGGVPGGRDPFDNWGHLADPNQRVSKIVSVEKIKRYMVGREQFTCTALVHGARSHCLVICPKLDEVLHQSDLVRLNPKANLIFRPELVAGLPPNMPEDATRSYLHPALILTFLHVTVEVFHKDYVARADKYQVNNDESGLAYVVLPFALCRLHAPHLAHRHHAWGDLCEIWSSNFAQVDWTRPERVAAHLIPLNRLAGKFSPGFLNRKKAFKEQGLPMNAEEKRNGMMVLRHPLH